MLKVWHDGYDWVVADEADATAAWQDQTGELRNPDADPWREWIIGAVTSLGIAAAVIWAIVRLVEKYG